MKYLLDTNICIHHLNQRSEAITHHLTLIPETDIAVCSIVKAELFYGAFRSKNPARNLERQQFFLSRFVSLPFDDLAVMSYARIRAELTQTGQTIGPNDFMIAAIALAHNLILVTANEREFSRVSELSIENWGNQ